jgi:hypothetical protein
MTTSAAASQKLPPEPGQDLRAEPGDILITSAAGTSALPRAGTIISASPGGSPPYLVHWHIGDYESRIWPAPGTRVRKQDRPAARS